MKKTAHFDFDVPLSTQKVIDGRIATICTGSLNLSGVGILDRGEYEYEDLEIRYKRPTNHPDYSPFGRKIDLEEYEAIAGYEPREDDTVHNAIMDHLSGLFSEEKDIAEHEQRDLQRHMDMTNQLMSSLTHPISKRA